MNLKRFKTYCLLLAAVFCALGNADCDATNGPESKLPPVIEAVSDRYYFQVSQESSLVSIVLDGNAPAILPGFTDAEFVVRADGTQTVYLEQLRISWPDAKMTRPDGPDFWLINLRLKLGTQGEIVPEISTTGNALVGTSTADILVSFDLKESDGTIYGPYLQRLASVPLMLKIESASDGSAKARLEFNAESLHLDLPAN